MFIMSFEPIFDLGGEGYEVDLAELEEKAWNLSTFYVRVVNKVTNEGTVVNKKEIVFCTYLEESERIF